MKHTFAAQSLTICLLIGLSFNASAFTCNQQSPNLEKAGTDYFDVEEPVSLSKKQKLALSKLFKRFNGKKLLGTGSTSECMGSVKSPRQKVTPAIIKAKLKHFSDGKTTLSVESFIESRKITRHEKYQYFGNKKPYIIEELNNTKLVISFKIRRKNIFDEEITEISVGNKTISIKTVHYFGGYFAYQKTAELSF